MKKNITSDQIRNFSIIAHIDHGKSTLADRFLELAQVTDSRTHKEQILDNMELERERGITIKSNSASFYWHNPQDNREYFYNLIDTPGHVDFSYEVSRALKACEGVLLLIDATQGVEAQTLANLYLALEHELSILPVINKIDLPAANIEHSLKLIEDTLGLDPNLALAVSAKTGQNIATILESIAKHIPPPQGSVEKPLRALIYDSYYDSFSGAVIKARIFDGALKKNDRIRMMSGGHEFQVTELGTIALQKQAQERLQAGEVGYIVAGIKTVAHTRVGDTITLAQRPAQEPLAGYQEVKAMVFAGLFPVNGEDFQDFREAIAKLRLNDAALSFEQDSSPALGFGFRVGYLGLLHMEIVQERLRREFGLELISTAPSVCYNITNTKGGLQKIDNPAHWPASTQIAKMEEPIVRATILSPQEYLGNIFALLQEKRGVQENVIYMSDKKAQLIYRVPLAELVFEFYDRLKSCSRGYASLDYELADFAVSQLVKVDILVNGLPVDALAMIVHRKQAEARGRHLIEKLKELIPRHQFQIPLQAAIGAKIIARENISALRKNVTAKCYGGDITRKRKLNIRRYARSGTAKRRQKENETDRASRYTARSIFSGAKNKVLSKSLGLALKRKQMNIRRYARIGACRRDQICYLMAWGAA